MPFLRDYWIQDITSFNDKYNQVLIAKLEDAKIISDITKENKGESRSFFGEHEDFMTILDFRDSKWIN